MEKLGGRCGPRLVPMKSMPSRGESDWVRAGYLVYVFGMVFDQLSTRLAISHPGIVEGNPIAAGLIEAGAWLAADLVLMFVVLTVCHLITKKFSDGRDFSTSFLVTCGSVRAMAAVWNVHLYLNIVNIL